MIAGSAVPLLALLAGLGLIGGIGITALGPGGVLPTIGLFALTDLSASAVAGTSIVIHIATGVLGTAVYTRSGQLRRPRTRWTAIVLATTAVAGAPLGVVVNSLVSQRAFGIVLATTVGGPQCCCGTECDAKGPRRRRSNTRTPQSSSQSGSPWPSRALSSALVGRC